MSLNFDELLSDKTFVCTSTGKLISSISCSFSQILKCSNFALFEIPTSLILVSGSKHFNDYARGHNFWEYFWLVGKSVG